jgi:hypothetical protein
VSQPHFERVWGWHSHSRNGDLGSPSRLLKIQNSIVGVKTPRLGQFFILLKRSWSVDVKNGLAWAIRISTTQVMCKRRAGSQNWQFDSRPLKVENRPDPDVRRWSVTHHWKAFKESYKFVLDLIPIGGLNKELWAAKVSRVQIETISGQFRNSSLGVPGKSAIGM